MKLYVGGAFQGKKAFVDNEYMNVKKLSWYDGACRDNKIQTNSISSYDAIYNYQEIIKRQLANKLDPEKELEELIKLNPQIILVCNEVGCGVIPITREDRAFREAVGRCMCMAASKADKVTRIICGIGQVIKS